jgi:hypothetical protein
VDFFSGELKRLQGHLDFMSAVCFKLGFQGPVSCRPSIEMWCDGERVDIAKYGIGKPERTDEISFTLRQLKTHDNKISYKATFGGVQPFSRDLEQPRSRQHFNTAFGPVSIRRPVELSHGHDSTVVWAMGAGNGFDIADQAAVEKAIKTAPWIMLVRIEVSHP